MPRRREGDGWRLCPRHRWEDTNKILVIGIGKGSENRKQLVTGSLRKLLDEFQLLFEVQVVPTESHVTSLTREVLQTSLTHGQIDPDAALHELIRKRKECIKLHPAIVLVIDQSEYKFTDPDAKYGVGYDDGLVILREIREEAVRHEIGHMLGISSHCDKSCDCVMRWECPSKDFCALCGEKLRRLWSETAL
ncbi:MAG TPA: hypothetical protein VJM51_02900 [Dehalococcoidia bacterium]|nr:hypothetical protein [Dehalococcoidia bacterium]